MQIIKQLTTKAVVECLLALDGFMALPLGVRIAFKKHLISEHKKIANRSDASSLSCEEQSLLDKYLPTYLPAITLNLEQIAGQWILEHEHITNSKAQFSYSDIMLLFIRFSNIEDCKSLLPIPFNV